MADAAEAAKETAAAVPAEVAGGQPPGAPRAPGVYIGLECHGEYCALGVLWRGAALAEGVVHVVCSGCSSVVNCDAKCQGARWEAHMRDCWVACISHRTKTKAYNTTHSHTNTWCLSTASLAA